MFYETKAEPHEIIYMSVIRPVSTVGGIIICVCLICMYSHCKELQCWE